MKTTIFFVLTLVFAALTYWYPHTMLNPGELTQGHQKLKDKCLACHTPFEGISNTKCISCHKLSEIGKNDSSTKAVFHKSLSAINCTSCHSDHIGINPSKALKNFNHALLPESSISNCATCHTKPADNLHKRLSFDCKSCHNTNGWKSSVVFNHTMIEGTGKNKCNDCHKNPADAFHADLKDNCSKCHGTNKWVPSTFNHSSYFILDKNHNAKCTVCHTSNNYKAYTCYGCHEHTQSKIIQEHNEEGISNINNCVSCHKSGNEDDIRMNGERKKKNNERENDDD
jgi:hypothetical protein